jgi:hypothetical protein
VVEGAELLVDEGAVRRGGVGGAFNGLSAT